MSTTENGQTEKSLTIPQRSGRPGRKVPKDLAEVFANLDENGVPRKAIAEMFGVNRGTVKRAIDRIPTEDLRALRKALLLRQVAVNEQLLQQNEQALLERDMNEKDSKGKYLVSAHSLMIMRAILTDKQAMVLPEPAGIADAKEGGSGGNPFAALLQTEQEMKEALACLPKGMRQTAEMSLKFTTEMSDTPQAPSAPQAPGEGAVEASYEEVSPLGDGDGVLDGL